MKTLPRPKNAIRRAPQVPFGVRVSGMWIVTPEQAKANFPELLDYISRRRNFVVIDYDGKPGAVLAKPDDSWKATIEIISDPQAMADIRRAKRDLAAGRYIELRTKRDFDQLFGADTGPSARAVRRQRKRRATR